MKNLFKSKYHLIYASLAQVIIIGVNLGVLISFNYKLEFNNIFYIVIPNLFYTFFACSFYYIYWKNIKKENRGTTRYNKILFNTIIFANIIYYIVCLIDTENGLYYIDTVIVQVISAFFAARYIIISAEPITTGKELVILKVFIYAAVIATLLSLYYCFINIFMTWILIIISAILLFISYSIYHTHFMRKYFRSEE
jgi:hypothetical protein